MVFWMQPGLGETSKQTPLVFAYVRRVRVFGYDVGFDHVGCDRHDPGPREQYVVP